MKKYETETERGSQSSDDGCSDTGCGGAAVVVVAAVEARAGMAGSKGWGGSKGWW